MDVIYEQNLKHVLDNADKLNQWKQTIAKNDHDTNAKGSEENELRKSPIVDIFQSSLCDIEAFYEYDSGKFAVRYNGESSLTWLHRDQLQDI